MEILLTTKGQLVGLPDLTSALSMRETFSRLLARDLACHVLMEQSKATEAVPAAN